MSVHCTKALLFHSDYMKILFFVSSLGLTEQLNLIFGPGSAVLREGKVSVTKILPYMVNWFAGVKGT